MIAPLRYFISILLLRKSCYLLTINRHNSFDTMQSSGHFDCSTIGATSSPSALCTCSNRFPTLMSSNSSVMTCQQPRDAVKCRVSVLTINDTTTTTKTSINPTLPTTCSGIETIHMWTLNDKTGVWVDINNNNNNNNNNKNKRHAKFFISTTSSILTFTSNTTQWGGQLLMIRLNNCDQCLIVKFTGTVRFSVNASALRMVAARTRSGSALSVTSITIIIIATLALLVLASVMCIFRQKMSSCGKTQREDSWAKKNYSADSTTKINTTMDPPHHDHIDAATPDTNDPWFEINKLSALGAGANNSRHSRKPSGDSFYIPTIREFFRERNSRGRNVYDVNFTQDPNMSRVQHQTNPYQESASS